MSPGDGLRAIRTSVALSRLDHVTALRVSGPGAFDTVDRLCPREVFLQDGQLLHTVFLSPADARVIADAYVGRDDEDYLLLVDGLAPDATAELVRAARPTGAATDTDVVVESASHRLLAINGPYAWELMGELAGPEIIGLPYLTFFRGDEYTCFRAGKTGEYGYELLVPAAAADALAARVRDIGARFDLAEADLATLDQASVESGFLSMRWLGTAFAAERGLSPLELQLQWRVSRRKDHLASAALAARRAAGVARRTTAVVSATEMRPGDDVTLDGQLLGTLLATAWSPPREDWVGVALLDAAWAVPGIPCTVRGPARTASAPLLDNRSLFVSPQRHSYATRGEHEFPAIAPRQR